MNYNNNYYNPNAYNGYYNVPNQNNYNFQNNNLNKTIFSFVNGIDEARAFIVSPNQVAYLMDNNSSHLFIKKADQTGRYMLEDYIVTKAEQENSNFASQKEINDIKTQLATLSNAVSQLINAQQPKKEE